MEDIFKIISKSLVASLLIFIAASISGTILWLLYDHIHALFPSAASHNIIAKNLGWWDSVCVTWIFSILIKPKVNNN